MWIFSSCLKMVVAIFYWMSVMCRHCTRFFTALSFILFPSTKIDMVSTIFHSFIQHVFVSDIYIYLYLYTNIYICIYIWFLECAQALSQVLRMFQWAKQPPKITSSWSIHFHKRDRWRSGSLWGSDKPRLHAWWWKRESMQLDLPDSKPVPFALYHQFICWKRV